MANTNELFPLQSEQPKGKDFKSIFSRYSRYWYLFLIGAVLALGTAYAYLRYYAVPIYEVASTLLINTEGGSPMLAGGSGGISLVGPSKDLNNEIQVLKSKSLMERVVKELSLFTTYYIEGRVKDVEVYGKSSPINVVISKMDSTAFEKAVVVRLKPNNSFELREGENNVATYQLGQLVQRPYASFTVVAAPYDSTAGKLLDKNIIVSFHDIRNVAAYFSSAVKITPAEKDATVLLVSMQDAVPERGKDIINKLITIYDKEAVEYKNRNAASTIAFLDERLKYLTEELKGVENDVAQFKSQNDVTDISSQASNYIAQASTYNKQLSDWAIQIDVLESIEKYLQNNTDQYSMVPSTLGIQDATLVGLIERFNTLQLERERQLRTVEASSPIVQNINEQIANLRSNILENLQNIKRGLMITSRNLKASSGQFQSQIKRVPKIEREMKDISRQQEIKQELYTYLLQRREEAALTLAAAVSSSRVIDPAIGGDWPVSPQRQMIYLMALLLGLSIPFTGIYIKELLNDKVQTVGDVEYLTNTPILGELALNNSKDALVVTQNSHSPVAEMFRLIRANLNFATLKQDNKVILVTSSMSGEGKTFFSINFASSLLLAGKKVVLLELDLRNSDLSYVLDLQEGPGITDYLTSNDIFISDIVRKSDKVPGLHVISSGPTPTNPSELMMSSKLEYLITELRESFDYILLDTAPVGKVADVFSLAPLVDSTIYMVRCNYTYKKMITIVDDIYRHHKLNNTMIVINDAKTADGNTYGYGYEKKSGKTKRVLS